VTVFGAPETIGQPAGTGNESGTANGSSTADRSSTADGSSAADGSSTADGSSAAGAATLGAQAVRALAAAGLDAADVVRAVSAALDEDFRYGPDVTSAATVAGRTVTADVVAREAGVVAGLPVALAVFDLIGDYLGEAGRVAREPTSGMMVDTSGPYRGAKYPPSSGAERRGAADGWPPEAARAGARAADDPASGKTRDTSPPLGGLKYPASSDGALRTAGEGRAPAPTMAGEEVTAAGTEAAEVPGTGTRTAGAESAEAGPAGTGPAGARVTVTALVADGTRVRAGDAVLRVSGDAVAVLGAERTMLNFLTHLSGIASATRQWADVVAGTGAVVRDTRKTLPGLRSLEKYAVRCGGGENHRMGLGDAALVKDNHVAAAGGVAAAVRAVRAAARPGLVIEVECDSVAQVREALAAGAPFLLLDNMPVPALREAVAVARAYDGVRLEASGGLRLANAREVAAAGVDYLSVGGLTHSARALDLGLDYRDGDAA
jgi:nicotinate-nucleotide pyrophosphorylase (carboxylating)